MTTLAKVYEALKYHTVISPVTGARRHYNAASQLHCEEGPAVEWPDGSKQWWLNGKRYTKQKYLAKIKTLEQAP